MRCVPRLTSRRSVTPCVCMYTRTRTGTQVPQQQGITTTTTKPSKHSNSKDLSDERLVRLIQQADWTIRPHIVETPLIRASSWLHHQLSSSASSSPSSSSSSIRSDNGVRIALKMDSEQITGSFKARGAANRIIAASRDPATRGFTTASTGNHALACLYAVNNIISSASSSAPARRLPLRIYLPTNAAQTKV